MSNLRTLQTMHRRRMAEAAGMREPLEMKEDKKGKRISILSFGRLDGDHCFASDAAMGVVARPDGFRTGFIDFHHCWSLELRYFDGRDKYRCVLHDPSTGLEVSDISSGWVANPSGAFRLALARYDELNARSGDHASERPLLFAGRPSGEIYLALKCHAFQDVVYRYFRPQSALPSSPLMQAWMDSRRTGDAARDVGGFGVDRTNSETVVLHKPAAKKKLKLSSPRAPAAPPAAAAESPVAPHVALFKAIEILERRASVTAELVFFFFSALFAAHQSFFIEKNFPLVHR